MELTDLDGNERLALVALIEATVQADRGVSAEEEEVLADIVDALGEDAYREAVEAADKRFKSEADLKAFLQGIKREEARNLIYGTLLDLAMSDVVTGSESPLLSWLASTWNVEAAIEPATDAADDAE
jgi:uncharacterized tellurite resistance protein B-like protein